MVGSVALTAAALDGMSHATTGQFVPCEVTKWNPALPTIAAPLTGSSNVNAICCGALPQDLIVLSEDRGHDCEPPCPVARQGCARVLKIAGIDRGVERPCAVAEYLVERMILGGADKICFVISPGKSDIMEYFGASFGSKPIVYVVQPQPAGLCDAVFCAAPVIDPEDDVVIGLPDTVWFPEAALAALPEAILSFLLFPVERPEYFDAVVLDADGQVREIQVQQRDAASNCSIRSSYFPPISRNISRRCRRTTSMSAGVADRSLTSGTAIHLSALASPGSR